MEEAANSLSRLNIASEGKAAMSELEWTGKYDDKNGESTTKIIELDNDDEDNPLKILAQVSIIYIVIIIVNFYNKKLLYFLIAYRKWCS